MASMALSVSYGATGVNLVTTVPSPPCLANVVLHILEMPAVREPRGLHQVTFPRRWSMSCYSIPSDLSTSLFQLAGFLFPTSHGDNFNLTTLTHGG